MNKKRQVPKEWACNSGAYRRLHYVIGWMFVLVAFVCWKTTQYPEFVAQYPSSAMFAYISAGVAAFAFIRGRLKAGNLKQVRFTADSVYIGRKKIDLKYVKSIHFVEFFYGRYYSIMGFHFCMEFEPNTIQDEDVHFSMEFYKKSWGIPLSSHENYDFRSQFIDVIMSWADKRKNVSLAGAQRFDLTR